MLITTVDGLWVLQVLTGAEIVAPELGLRPVLPSLETAQLALTHPVAAELRAEGVLNDAGEVDDVIVEWLTVLRRRDIAVLVQRPAAAGSAECDRALLARFAQWWVVLERSAEFVRICGAGTATAPGAARHILRVQVERLCGTCPPAALRPVTLDVDALLTGVRDQQTLDAFLDGQRLDREQLRVLAMAADPAQSVQASLVALQAGMAGAGPTRTHVEPSAVTIIDTAEGRLVAEHVCTAEKKWMVISPGTATNIGAAVEKMLRRLPADAEWHSHRKAV